MCFGPSQVHQQFWLTQPRRTTVISCKTTKSIPEQRASYSMPAIAAVSFLRDCRWFWRSAYSCSSPSAAYACGHCFCALVAATAVAGHVPVSTLDQDFRKIGVAESGEVACFHRPSL